MTVSTPHHTRPESTKITVAHGASIFGGVLLVTAAVFQAIEGISAIAKDDVLVTGVNYTWQFSISTWGWIHLIIGIVGLVVGIGILMDQAWAFVVGILIAGIGAIANFGFLPYYPFWTVVLIALDVFVIWALCTRLANDT